MGKRTPSGKSDKQTLSTVVSKFTEAQADYKANKKGRFNPRRKHIATRGSSADYHIRSSSEYYNLIEDCYDMERNDSVVGQLTDRRTSNVIQDGFRFAPDTGEKELDEDLKAEFNEWANDPEQCDVSGEACFHDFEYALDWTHILAGDAGVSFTDSGHLQFFEPYIIRKDDSDGSDGIIHGVELDDAGRRLKYYIAEDNNNPYDNSFNTFTPVETRSFHGIRQFFHVLNPKRLHLTRGVSAYAPIFELSGMLEDVNFAKLVQQQIVSCIAFLFQQSETAAGTPGTTANFGNQTTGTSDNGQTQTFDEVEPGMEVHAAEGQTVQGFSPNIPNPEYFEQYRLILQLICGNLEMPLSVGMMDSSETNFHGFIGAANEAKKLWKKSQHRLIKRFHKPVAIAKLHQFARTNRQFNAAKKRLGERFFRHTWHTPVWQSVKPLDDTTDRLMRLRNAIVSPSKMQAELSTDYESHVEETIRDNSLAIRKAKTEAMDINKEFQDGQPVHWNQLYPMPTPDGIQATAEIVKENREAENESTLSNPVLKKRPRISPELLEQN